MRFLDYQKVKQAERQKARELFGTAEEPTELASKVRASPPPPTYVLMNGFASGGPERASAPRDLFFA